MTLNQFHINAILAGLRLLERTDFADLPGDVQEIYGGELLPLTRDDIDTLCQNISTVPKGWLVRAVCVQDPAPDAASMRAPDLLDHQREDAINASLAALRERYDADAAPLLAELGSIRTTRVNSDID